MQGFWNDWNNGDDKQYNNNIPKCMVEANKMIA